VPKPIAVEQIAPPPPPSDYTVCFRDGDIVMNVSETRADFLVYLLTEFR